MAQRQEKGVSEGGGPEAAFRAHLAAGRFMIQRCRETGEHVFYPRVFAPGDDGGSLEWVEASGRGVVYATTITRRKPERGGDYNICLVELAEGPRLMSRVVGVGPEEVRIGMPVRARIDTLKDEPALVFASVGEGER